MATPAPANAAEATDMVLAGLGYLAVITVAGNQPFGRQHVARLADAVRRCR